MQVAQVPERRQMVKYLLPALVAATALAQAPAQAVTIDFNNYSPDGQCGELSTDGLTFTPGIPGMCVGVWNNASSGGAYNGTLALIYAGPLVVTPTDGGLFKLSQFDAGLSWYTAATLHTLTATAVLADDSLAYGFADITKEFSTIPVADIWLKSITFDGIDDGYITLDNIGVTYAPLPEPASWALLIVGFGLIGVTVRQRRTATA